MGVATGGRGDTLYKVGERKAKLARRTVKTKARRTSKEGSDVGVECAQADRGFAGSAKGGGVKGRAGKWLCGWMRVLMLSTVRSVPSGLQTLDDQVTAAREVVEGFSRLEAARRGTVCCFGKEREFCGIAMQLGWQYGGCGGRQGKKLINPCHLWPLGFGTLSSGRSCGMRVVGLTTHRKRRRMVQVVGEVKSWVPIALQFRTCAEEARSAEDNCQHYDRDEDWRKQCFVSPSHLWPLSFESMAGVRGNRAKVRGLAAHHKRMQGVQGGGKVNGRKPIAPYFRMSAGLARRGEDSGQQHDGGDGGHGKNMVSPCTGSFCHVNTGK